MSQFVHKVSDHKEEIYILSPDQLSFNNRRLLFLLGTQPVDADVGVGGRHRIQLYFLMIVMGSILRDFWPIVCHQHN